MTVMPLSRSPIRVAIAAAALGVPAAACAQLPLPVPLPDPVQIVTQATGALPDPVGGVVTQTTGDAGGLVQSTTGGLTGTISQTVDQVLGGGLGQLPTGTVDDLLSSIGVPGANGAPGVPGTPGVTVLPDGTILVDSRAPVTSVKVLSKVRQIGRTGRLRLQITSDEPSVVALAGAVRPGIARKVSGHRVKGRSRKPIRIPAVVLAYRRAGALNVTVQFSRKAQRNLDAGRSARLSVALVAVDVARNQVRRNVKRVIKR